MTDNRTTETTGIIIEKDAVVDARIEELEARVADLVEKLGNFDGETYCGGTIVDWYEMAVRLQAQMDERVEELEALVEAEREDAVFWEAECGKICNMLEDMQSTHMKLPVDADGVPIRPWQTLYDGEREIPGGCVYAVNDEHVYIWHYKEARCITGVNANNLTHKRQDTVESLLREMAREVEGDDWMYCSGRVIEEYAERIKEAVEHED